MSKQKVIIHCQYVYGLGHLVRALHLAKGLAKHFEVYFLNGGEVVKNFEVDSSIKFIQLPSIYKKEDSNKLTSVSADLSLSECFHSRDQIISKTIQKVKPDVVITEHFPFGFLFEKEATKLIGYAKEVNSKSKIVCSVRDVIESTKGGNNDEKTIAILNELYDLILIHGDKKLISVESSFPLVKKIKIKLVYTGYVIDQDLPNDEKRTNNILVSVAGGRVGSELLNAVIEAFEMIKMKSTHNLVVFNGAFNKDFTIELKRDRVTNFNFDRKEFLKQLSQSDVSISLGGYNSTMESLYAGNKVVIYNREFLGSNEEQGIRISTFKNLGLIDVISLEDLEVNKLAKELTTQINKKDKARSSSIINFGGIENTVIQIKELVYGE
jgi:predicted glycosyltransferase